MNCKLLSFVAGGFLCLSTSIAVAVPTVSNVTDLKPGGFLLLHNQTLTINGSGFGAKVSPGPLRFETFEEKDSGGLPAIGNRIAQEISYWTDRGPTYDSLLFTADNPRTPASSRNVSGYYEQAGKTVTHAGVAWTKNQIGFGATGKMLINLWLRFKWPTYTNQDGADTEQVKLLAVTESIASNGSLTYPGFEATNFNYLNNYSQSFITTDPYGAGRVPVYHKNDSLPATMDNWVNYVIMVDEGTYKVANGYVLSYLSRPDGAGPYDKTEKANMLLRAGNADLFFDYLKFGFYWQSTKGTSGLAGYGNTRIYYDDIYVDNTWARVELGDASVYDNCSHREIQIPTAWDSNGGNIQIKLNTAAFPDKERLYLFVFDDSNNGNVNDGFELYSPIAPVINNVIVK